MKVYISADLEGISGVSGRDQLGHDGADYGRCRTLMAGEVNAAVEGAFEGGAAGVVVNDSHGDMKNIRIEELDARARLLTGSPKPLGMMQGIDRGFDAAIFVGYHARAGTRGLLNHTILGRVISSLSINGVPSGETRLNAGLAGWFGVPVVLVTGDDHVEAEARAAVPGIRTVAVKEAFGRMAALCLTPQESRRLIKDAARSAVEAAAGGGAPGPLALESPVTFEITFMNSAMAEMAELVPGSRRAGDLSIAFTSGGYLEGYRTFRAAVLIAAGVA